MTKRFLHNNFPPQESSTTVLLECVRDFAFRETQKISEKYNVDIEVVVAIVDDWKRAEAFLTTEGKGTA